MRKPWQQRSLVFLLLMSVFQGHASTQGGQVEILLPGEDYHRNDLPSDSSGAWWVLHRPNGGTVLEAMEPVVTSFRTCGDEDPSVKNGRALQVPDARGPILLLRGLQGLAPGSVRTAFVDTTGAGQSVHVEVPWEDSTVVVQRLVEGPHGDQAGQYRVELLLDTGRYQLHADEWQGDGHWRVRWIGDLNRDGWPDLLLDASYKYSVSTTRLYLSGRGNGGVEFSEVARLVTSAC